MPPSSPSDDTPAWIKGDLPLDEPPPAAQPNPQAATEPGSAPEPNSPAEPASLSRLADEPPADEPAWVAEQPELSGEAAADELMPEPARDSLLAAVLAARLSEMEAELNDSDELLELPAGAEPAQEAPEGYSDDETLVVIAVEPDETDLAADADFVEAADDEADAGDDDDDEEDEDDENDEDEDDEDEDDEDEDDEDEEEEVIVVIEEPAMDDAGSDQDQPNESDADEVVLVVVDAAEIDDGSSDEDENEVEVENEDDDDDVGDAEDNEDDDGDEDEEEVEVEEDETDELIVEMILVETGDGADEGEAEPAGAQGLPDAALLAELGAADEESGASLDTESSGPPAASEMAAESRAQPEPTPGSIDDQPTSLAATAPTLPPIEPPVVEDLGLEALIESLLFVADGAVPVGRLAEALEVPAREVEAALSALGDSYRQRGLSIQRFREKVQLTTSPSAAAKVERFLGLAAATPLSRAALEALAIVAYQQPVTRPQIEAVRGVNSDSVIKNLLTKGLIEESGRAEGPGRPVLYSTTPEFMQHFGLTSLSELPPLSLPSAGAMNPEQILKG